MVKSLTTSALMGVFRLLFAEVLKRTMTVKMTQVYAKIINRKKDEAVNLVNGLFD